MFFIALIPLRQEPNNNIPKSLITIPNLKFFSKILEPGSKRLCIQKILNF